jgi:predicted esterase
MSEARSIAVHTHGRYLVAAASDAHGWIVGFHGYGNSAAMMMDELASLPDAARWTIVSIQGLHRFYNRENVVVASWMTREDRDLAIDDNVRYVDAVLDEVARERGEPRRLVFSGFSQGVAMAYRAAARVSRRPHAVIALAGDVPPELAAAGTTLPRVLIGRGTKDAWYTEAKMGADLAVLERLKVPAQTVVFDGGHEWAPQFKAAAAQFLRDVANG